MKQRGLPPWDLTASVLIAASALAFSMFSSDRVASPLGSLLFVLVLLLPGYLLSIIIFPRRYEIAGKGRLAISIGMDVILVLLLSLGLSLSSWGLHLSSLAASAAIIVLVLAAIAHLNRSALPIWNRFVPIVSGSGRSPSRQRQEGAISRRTIAALFALAATVVLVAVAYTAINAYTTINTNDAEINTDETGDVGDARFTEFYILGEKDEAHPTPVMAGKMIATTAGIINHEHKAVNYTLMLALNGALLLQKEIKLNHNQSWEGVVDYVLENSGSWQRLDFLLYKEGDFSLPYSEDHLWFNVSGEATPASQNSSDASENDTTALQKMSKVVVLGIKDNDEDKSKNKKRNSDSNKASQQAVPQPSQTAAKLQSEDHTEQFTLQEMESDLVETFDQVDEGSGDIRSKDISILESRSIESDIKETGSSEGDEKLVATAVVLETDALKLDLDKPLDKSETETLNEGNSKSENSKIDDSKQNDFEMDNPGQSKQEVDNPKAEAPKVEPFEVKLPKLELTKVEPPKAEPPKEKPPKVAPPEIRPPKFEPIKIKLPKVEVDTTKVDTTKVVTSKSETSKVDDLKKDTSKMDNSDADNSEISESAAASGDSNSLAGKDEAKGPAKNDPETEQKDSESSSTSADSKDDASVSKDGKSVSQKEEAAKASEMDSEIDSWVGTRSFSKSGQSQSFKSKNIKYVKKGDSGGNAVLGSQSKTPVRVGRQALASSVS